MEGNFQFLSTTQAFQQKGADCFVVLIDPEAGSAASADEPPISDENMALQRATAKGNVRPNAPLRIQRGAAGVPV